MKWAAIALGSFLSFFNTTMTQQPQTPDEKTLAELRKAGSDLSKFHEIDHWLYFKIQDEAEAASKELTAKGFKVSSIAKKEQEWRVLAHIRMVPSSRAVADTTLLLESIASAHAGSYDGWETQVVR